MSARFVLTAGQAPSTASRGGVRGPAFVSFGALLTARDGGGRTRTGGGGRAGAPRDQRAAATEHDAPSGVVEYD